MIRTGAAVAIICLSGCGGSGAARSASTPAPHQTPTVVQPSAAAGSLAVVQQRLTSAGFAPQETAGQFGTAVDEIQLAGNTSIYGYRTTADAQGDSQGIATAQARHPGWGMVAWVATHVYFTGETHALSAQERATFRKVVALGEARK